MTSSSVALRAVDQRRRLPGHAPLRGTGYSPKAQPRTYRPLRVAGPLRRDDARRITCMTTPRRSRDPLEPGAVSPRRTVPSSIARPEYVDRPAPRPFTGSEVKTPETIERIRGAARLAAQALEVAGAAVAPVVPTDEIYRIGHEILCDHGA